MSNLHQPSPPEPPARKALGWAAGFTLAVLLAGGTIAAVALTGQSSGRQSTAGSNLSAAHAPAHTASGTGQAALLNATLHNASAPGALAPVTVSQAISPAARAAGATAHRCLRARHVAKAARRAGLRRVAKAARRAARHCRARRRHVMRFFLLRGVDGQFTIKTAKGTKTLAFERGVIESVTQGRSIQVKASDGTTMTWDLASSTVVRGRNGKLSGGSLSNGEPVWVGGPVTGGTRDARLIVIKPPVQSSGT